MMARRGVIGLTAGTVAMMLAGCGLFNSTASFRYRLTVEGAHPGTAVYEILAEKNNDIVKLPEEKPGESIIRGEALAIETPTGPVFLLLQSAKTGGELKGAVMRALAPGVSLVEEPYSYAVASRLSGAGNGQAKGELPRAEWPMMVRFRDLNDPKSVEKVDPDAIGVKRIVLETTSDAMTTGIEKRFPTWFIALYKKGATLSGDTSHIVSTNKLEDNLGPDSFGGVNIK